MPSILANLLGLPLIPETDVHWQDSGHRKKSCYMHCHALLTMHETNLDQP